MKRSLLILAIVGVLFFVTIVATIWLTPSKTTNQTDTVIVDSHIFEVTVARTPQQQVDGLAGWAHLSPNQGMYFPLDNRNASFWMKGMLIDIDIIWIDNGKVVGIDRNAQAPDNSTPDHELPSFPSPVTEPDAVLEIAAGRAEELGIEVGDKVETRF